MERGVKEKIRNFESEMIDEMLQAALNIDVDKEIESRLDRARRVAEDQNASDPYKMEHSRSAGKKNVKF